MPENKFEMIDCYEPKIYKTSDDAEQARNELAEIIERESRVRGLYVVASIQSRVGDSQKGSSTIFQASRDIIEISIQELAEDYNSSRNTYQ